MIGIVLLGVALWLAIVLAIIHAVSVHGYRTHPETQRAEALYPDSYAVIQSWNLEN